MATRRDYFKPWTKKIPRWALVLFQLLLFPVYMTYGIFKGGFDEAWTEYKTGLDDVIKIDEEY